MTKKSTFLLSFILFCTTTVAQTPCENGTANGYDCNQVDFLSRLSNIDLAGSSGVQGNDIWGWTDPSTGKEYVLMGQTNGVVFVDISDPLAPVIVGRLPSHTGTSSSWRDIKVYNNHAFVVADSNPGHGMQIFDLTRLRSTGNSIQIFDNDAHYDGVSSAHNVVINEDTGFAYIVGARNAGNDCGAGGLHIVNIQDPKNPSFEGCFDADGYTHDAQCVIYNGPDEDYQGQEICFNANENTVTIANVDDKENTVLIAKQGYAQAAYSHQGWLTEDQKYFISGDELDEGNSVSNTRTLVWDVRDLDNPTLLTQYFSERIAIDHNLYIKNQMIYQSNYTTGLIILDSKKVGNRDLREVAFFDTFPQSNNISFNGSWSNYPFFESGVIAVSDINNGLFLLKENFKEIVIEHPAFNDCNATEQSINVTIDAQYQVEEYQWQAVIDNKPTNLEDDDNYSGTNTSELTINTITDDISAVKYRCKVKISTGEIAYSYLSNPPFGLPEPYFTFSISEDQQVEFFNNSEYEENIEWDFGDGSEVSTEQNPVHFYEELGEYTVSLTASNACGEQTYSETIDFSILNTRKYLDDAVKIYPNPVSNTLTVEKKKDARLLKYRILDISGRTVFESINRSAQEVDKISTADWESGIYLVILTHESGDKSVRKIIKQ